MSAQRQYLFAIAVSLSLILATVAVYAQTGAFQFLSYDDNLYVSQNAHVRAGLTPGTLKWALTASVAGNWAPVTMLSHLLAIQLFDMESGLHHLVNLLFHALSAVLLFLVLRRATGGAGASAFVAFVFALHPLHVEPVAWISERKEVLSAFFWFLALYAYLHYCERPSRGRYLLVVAPFCLGLMSKAMMVTFPFTLLLLDMWPLGRKKWRALVDEKLPLILLSAVASAVTYLVQESASAMEQVPFATRIGNAFLSYLTYIGQTLWPARLACFYPYSNAIPVWRAVLAAAVVLAVSALAIAARRSRSYFTVGWFWFLGTLIPVIGLVQVGMQAHADRYMYIPMVGLLLMVAWGAADAAKKWPWTRPAIALMVVVCCTASGALAWKQTSYWRNSETLFQHAIAVTGNNWLAETDLGIYLNSVGRAREAIPHLEAASRLKPDDGRAEDSLGASLVSLGDCGAAIPHFAAALRARPGSAKANYNLGYCLAVGGNDAAAVPYFEAAIRAQSDFADARVRLGMSLSKIPGRAAEAIAAYDGALRLRPADARTHARLGELLAKTGRLREAIAHLEAAERLNPNPAISKMLADARAAQRF